MNIVKVKEYENTPTIVRCCRCGKVAVIKDSEGVYDEIMGRAPSPVYADLEGEPFVAYYCAACCNQVQKTLDKTAS
jgi:hypothetical protein